jgi:hypothetical protein
MNDRPLPDAVCIGASKCGTTSLHYYLHAHPDIGVPRQKEVHFFLDPGNWRRGVDWYRQQFPSGKVRVESFGGGYTHFPMQQGVARRMADVLPHGKFIYMVRDPVERMLSRYIHNVCECLETAAPAEAFAGEPLGNPYIAESLYFTQLAQYREFFADDRFHVIEYEDFRHRRRATLSSVFRFLGVDETFWSPAFDVVRHPTAGKRRKTDFGAALHLRFGRHLLGALGRLPVPMPAQRWVTHRSDQALYWLFSRPMERPVLERALRQRLNDIFRPEVAQLEAFTGRRFSHWLADPGAE